MVCLVFVMMITQKHGIPQNLEGCITGKGGTQYWWRTLSAVCPD